jgi:hypothetical protein
VSFLRLFQSVRTDEVLLTGAPSSLSIDSNKAASDGLLRSLNLIYESSCLATKRSTNLDFVHQTTTLFGGLLKDLKLRMLKR